MMTGYLYYKNFKQNFEANIDNQLKIIADLKVGDLEKWIEERRADAETVAGNEVFSTYIKRYFKNPADSVAKREIKVWMKEFQIGFDYDAVKLIDPQLVKRIIIPEAEELNRANILPGNLDSLREGKTVFEDFYYNEIKQKVFLKILVPVLDLHKLIAIIELRINPADNLYQILSNWSGLGETSETFIIRQQGNEVAYLSELKFQKNSALNFRIPIENKNLKAVQVASGHDGILKGTGYRGTAVLAYVEKVPNSSWFLVAQIDESEAFAPLSEKLRDTMLFFFSIFLFAGMGLVVVWRNQRTIFFREKIKSAEALRESEERFRSLYENSTMGIYRTTPGGKILLANDALVKMLRFSSFEDFSSRDLEKEGFEPTYERKQFIEKIEKDGEIIGLEAEWSRKDGTVIYIRESARAIRDSTNKTLYYDGTVEDISEQKHLEMERQVLSEIVHSIVTTSNLAESLKLIHQSLGKVLYADNLFVALYDQNTELFSFPYWVDEFDPTPEPVAMLKSLTAYVFRTGKPILFSQELFQQLKEQDEVTLVGSPSPSWIGVPLQTPARTIGVLVLQHYEKENFYSERDIKFLDTIGSQIALIIERKLAEETLRNERLLLRTVIDNIPDSIYCKNLDCRKTLVNLAELRYLKAKSDTGILGKDDFDLYPRELAEKFFADDQMVLQTGNPVLNREEYLFDENGDKLWLLTSKLPLRDSNGQIIGLVGMGHNITDRKHADEEIRSKNEELLKANSEKDKFFSIIAHDLRGPFNGFLGLTEIMVEDLPTLTMDGIQEIATSLRSSATNLFRLLENLLEWAKMQQGLIPFDPKMVELLPIVDECISIMHELAKNKGIELASHIPEEISVFADSNILKTIIRNLVSNALKYTTKGGKVNISAKTMADKGVEISISDTGMGMKKEIVENLFRLDVNTNRKGTEGEPSSGLGLLLCKEFIEEHGGKIWVESEEGKGSVFNFTIPDHAEPMKLLTP